MDDYIDREALLKRLCEGDPSRMEDFYYNAIAEAPAADVVEVVRCIDCVYWDGRGYDGRCEAPENGLIRDYTNYDDYCSYGERKKPNE